MIIRSVSILLVLLFTINATAMQNVQIVRHYIEKKGSSEEKIRWCLSQKEGFSLTYKRATEIHVTKTDKNLATLSWTMDDSVRECSVIAERKNNTIFLQGNIKGQPINESIKVDDCPWFQASSLSLKDFVISNKKQIKFWILRPKTLKAYKLKAEKLGIEDLQLKDRTMKTVKIRLSLDGWRSQLWSSTYWFSARDGLFLRFEAKTDRLGTEKVTVTYVD